MERESRVGVDDWAITISMLIVFVASTAVMAVVFVRGSRHLGRQMLIPAALFFGCLLMLLGVSFTGMRPIATYLGYGVLVGFTVAGMGVSCALMGYLYATKHPERNLAAFVWAIWMAAASTMADANLATASPVLEYLVTGMRVASTIFIVVLGSRAVLRKRQRVVRY
jgi:hypothetical protein